MFKRIVVASGGDPEGGLYDSASRLSLPGGEIHRFHVNSTRFGDTLDALLRHVAATEADLVAVGARSHLMARRVAMMAPCSTLMVPAGSSLELHRILVPVDFSETAAEAVREATRIARFHGSSVTVVAVETDDDEAWLDWRDDPGRSRKALAEFVVKHAGQDHYFDLVVEPAHGFDADALQAGGNVEGLGTAAAVVAVAKRLGSTFIVAGTRGRTRAATVLLGSVVERVVQLSPVPVLAVRRAGERLGLVQALAERIRDSDRPLVAG